MTETQWVIPKPVALVMRQLREIQELYLECRDDEGPDEALESAIIGVLADESFSVLRFIHGADDVYFSTAGNEFRKKLLEQFEGYRDDLAETAAKAQIWNKLDVVAFAEAVATDPKLAASFCGASEAVGARRVVDGVVGALLEKASKGGTKGRQAKVAQALRALEILGGKPDQVKTSDPAARNQAAWCAAVADRLRPYTR